ncbi:agmatine deiminase family protein [Psychrobacter immobilis]|uniref:agmatine deiminase family protein n=1 Tax=Psychrobacter immobilis TaxID=498 RepID=UPI00191ADC03|nr:agmatine deiminase family protein [Psychrobacter immobilis]
MFRSSAISDCESNETLIIKQLEKVFAQHQVVGVPTRESVFGGSNIHCITQQHPKISE